MFKSSEKCVYSSAFLGSWNRRHKIRITGSNIVKYRLSISAANFLFKLSVAPVCDFSCTLKALKVMHVFDP